LLIVADSIYNPATAKVVQSFEVADANNQIDFDALTWVKIDGNKDGKTYGVGTSNDAIVPSDGDYSLFFDPKGALSVLNEWVISPCFQLNAGTVYNLKVDAGYYLGASAAKTVKLFVGNDNKAAALTTQVGSLTINAADTLLTPKSIVFTVGTSGVYNLGLNIAATNGAYFAFDNLSVDVLAKPTSAFTLITDNSGNNDCDKSVGVKVTAANDPANTYAWSFGDGGTASGYAPAPHVYSAYGTYTVKLVVSNLAGKDSSTQTVTVAAPATPVANFTSQNTVGKTYKFTNASTPTACVTYFWDFGVTSTAADTSVLASPTYVYPTAGSYNVCLTVTNLDGVVNQKCATVNVATGIDDVLFNQNIAIYPNPSTGNVTFEVPTFEKNLSINVYNILGAEVKSIKEEANGMFNKNYNFSDLSNGTYIVKITNGNKTATKRLTINK
jgi:PKD repeat protein